MTKKTHPENVIPQLLEAAINTGKERNALFSEYVRLHWRTTGNLAPGVNASDFYAALDARAAEHSMHLSDGDGEEGTCFFCSKPGCHNECLEAE